MSKPWLYAVKFNSGSNYASVYRRVAFTFLGLIIGVLLMPLTPIAMAYGAWNEYEDD